MIEHFGQEYAIVKTIVNASIEAVKKELDAKAEVQKSDRARLTLYKTRVNGNRLISVPRDVWVHYRMIVAEFAKGTSLYSNSIPDDVRISMAEEILAMEKEILFADKNAIEFEPDRHAGNLRMSYEKATKKEQIRPIDFGQLSTISRENRQRIYDLFALAQIIRNVGVTQEAIKILKSEYPTIDEKKTEKVLRIYFAGKQPSELNAYFSVLSSLEEGGQKIDASLLDFMRAILQLKPYETLLPADSKAPKVTAAFQQQVETSVEKYRGRIASAITTSESAKVAWKKWRSGEMKTAEIVSAMKAKLRTPKVISCQRVLLP